MRANSQGRARMRERKTTHEGRTVENIVTATMSAKAARKCHQVFSCAFLPSRLPADTNGKGAWHE
eukprot:6971014-Pyramimonas_sp.AAC.1